MRKLLLFLFLLVSVSLTHGQRSTNLDPSLYGYWLNGDGEVLIIQLDNTFTRRTTTKVISTGRLELVDNELRVIRTDIEAEYSLGYHVRNDLFVVAKPGDANEAWLFTKIGN